MNWFGSMPIHPDHFGAAILDFDAWPFFISVYMGFFLVSVNFVLSFKMVRYIEKMGSLGGQLIKHTIH